MTDPVQHQRQLIFNDDGTIDLAQLEGLAPDVIERLTSPDFIATARSQIAAAKAKASFERGAKQIKAVAHRQSVQRRPPGVSGRQRRLLRKLARKVAVLVS